MDRNDQAFVCALCGLEFSCRRSLTWHVRECHSMTLRQYTIATQYDGIHPTCGCGCGNEVNWRAHQGCFSRYLPGHNPSGFRVKQPTFTREQIERRNAAIRTAKRRKAS